jgi:hypothetical protein
MRYYLRLRDERSAESFVFWNKGHTAFIEESQKITFKDCIATSTEKAPT